MNHRVGKVGRDLRRLSSPTDCRVNYSRLPRVMSSWILNISKDNNSTTSLGNTFHCSTPLTVKKFLLFLSEFFCISLCAHCFLSFPWTPMRRACLHLLYFPHQVFTSIDNIPLRFLFSWLNSSSSLKLSSGRDAPVP